MARRWNTEFEDALRRTDYAGQLTIDGEEVPATRRRRKPRNSPSKDDPSGCVKESEDQGDLFESYGVSS